MSGNTHKAEPRTWREPRITEHEYSADTTQRQWAWKAVEPVVGSEGDKTATITISARVWRNARGEVKNSALRVQWSHRRQQNTRVTTMGFVPTHLHSPEFFVLFRQRLGDAAAWLARETSPLSAATQDLLALVREVESVFARCLNKDGSWTDMPAAYKRSLLDGARAVLAQAERVSA